MVLVWPSCAYTLAAKFTCTELILIQTQDSGYAGSFVSAPDTRTTQMQEPPENPFNDVKESDWYYDAVRYAAQNGTFNGTGSNTFSPAGTMNRAMYVTVLGRLAGINPADYTGSGGFADVSADAYYAPYVIWAAQKGITKGVSGNSFSPSALVTREQMAALTVRFFDAYGITYPETTVTTQAR